MRKLWSALFLVLVVATYAGAQLKIYSIKVSLTQPTDNKTLPKARMAAEVTLTLPVWDDFSTSGSQPDTTIWYNSTNVFVNSGTGNMPPSLNVASFDGLLFDGSPYAPSETSEGKSDALITHTFDFSGKSAADNIYMSFFYQFAGNGEVPDVSDSLRVEFMNVDSVWVPVWPRGGANLDRSGDFVQVLLPVKDAEFLHGGFRFKFQAFGRQTGPFDVWNVDYILINNNRSPDEDGYPDRTVVTPISSILGEYTAVPRAHAKNLSFLSPTIFLKNIDNEGSQNITVDAVVKVIDYTDSVATSTTYSMSDVAGTVELEPFGKTKSASFVNFIPETALSSEADSSTIIYHTYMDSDDEEDKDELTKIIDFRVNDSTSSTFRFKDYYAYDDGEAELGIGVTQGGNQVAVRYEKMGESLNYIHAFDIYFPYANSSPNGKNIDLMVWSKIDTANNSSKVLYKEPITISSVPGLNRFTRFELREPVQIKDSIFYIGYRQLATGDLSVGFDKNTDNSSKIYYHANGPWEINKLHKGSLMIRPVFGAAPDEVTGIPGNFSPGASVYPNPTDGLLYIDSEVSNFEISSIDGRKKAVRYTRQGGRTTIDLSLLPQGIYLLKFVANDKVISKKIIKQ